MSEDERMSELETQVAALTDVLWEQLQDNVRRARTPAGRGGWNELQHRIDTTWFARFDRPGQRVGRS